MKKTDQQEQFKDNKPFYLIIGSFFLDQDYPIALRKFAKKNFSASNAQYEKKLLLGFQESGEDYVFISAPSIGGWPIANKKIFVRGFTSTENIFSVSYCSPYGLMNFFKGRAIARCAKHVLKARASTLENRPIIIVCCEAHRPYLIGAKWIKRHFAKQSFCTLIIPDMPEDMTKSKNLLYRFLKKRDIKSIKSLQTKYVDGFLCFTKFIEKALAHQGKPSVVMEGIIGCPEVKKAMSTKDKKRAKHCVFVGKTDSRNGISLILEAAKAAPAHFVFDIYGSGNMDNALRDLNCPNIKYHGFLEPSKIADVLKNADVVLSPRKPEGKYIYYSFPSKIFDYIAFDKKIVTYRLPCYFRELDEVLFYPENYSAASLLAAIETAVEADEQALIKKYSELKTRFSPVAAVEAIKSLFIESRQS